MSNEAPFYCKIVYTTLSKKYTVPTNSTITEFKNIIEECIVRDFRINSAFNIEIAEAGNSDNVNGRDAELYPALQDSEETLAHKYNNDFSGVAFYIRPILIGFDYFVRYNDYTVSPYDTF
jgi:hypothetical protein